MIVPKEGDGGCGLIIFYVICISAGAVTMSALGGAIGFLALLVLTVLPIVLTVFFRSRSRKNRVKKLSEFYGAEVAARIMNREIWVGQTEDQLINSIGRPTDIDEKVLKTKRKEIWKYHQKTKRSFGLKITLENDVVVGWDEKL